MASHDEAQLASARTKFSALCKGSTEEQRDFLLKDLFLL